MMINSISGNTPIAALSEMSCAMHIERNAYLSKLIARKHNRLVKVITGIRRCGKSFLLFEFFREHLREQGVPDCNVVEVSFDRYRNRALREPDALLAYLDPLLAGEGMHYLLLDEVQFLSSFEEVLIDLMAMPNVDVYVTGSNSKFLSTDIITEFRGRGDEIRVHPLNFAEFYSVWDGGWEDAWRAYYTYGGMPRIAGMSSEQEKIGYLERLFEEVYLRDIVERNGVRFADELGELVDFVASATGSLTNPARLAATFKSSSKVSISEATVAEYLAYLQDAFLISRARRYDVRGRKAIGSPYKYYFEDVGLRNARLKFRQQEPTHIMENVVYNELVMRGFAVDVGIVESRKMEGGVRRTQRHEIDFVANLGSKRYYIQSAYSMPTEEKRVQEACSLNGTGDSFKKIIVTHDDVMPCRDENGIVVMGLRDFLLNPDMLDW